MIRLAEPGDLPRLPAIELAAGALFRDVGMAAVADHDAPTLEDLAVYQASGRAWVATYEVSGDDVPVGYILVDVVDGAAHVEQVSVTPAFGRRGIGRSLVDTAARWAVDQECDAVTLTTFATVPWNAPYYARLGFTMIPDAELGPGLRAVRRRERELGLDAWPRVCMRRSLRDCCSSGAETRPVDTRVDDERHDVL